MASIMKRGNTYSVRYNYKDHAGKPCKGWETFKTKAEAQERKITVEKELLAKHGGPCAEALVESALGVAWRPIPVRRVQPDLQEVHGVAGRRIEFAVLDAGPGAHALHLAGLDGLHGADAVAVRQRARKHDRDDLHVGVRMGGKPALGCHHVLVDHPQRAKAHAARFVIVAEGEAVAAVEPGQSSAAAFLRWNELHVHGHHLMGADRLR